MTFSENRFLVVDWSINKLGCLLQDCSAGNAEHRTCEPEAELEGELSTRHLFLLKQLQAHITYLRNKLKELDDYLFSAMQPYQKQWELLQTIPGIDAVGAALLIIEIGVDRQQFGSREQFCSWAGMCPGNNESAGKKKAVKHQKVQSNCVIYFVRRQMPQQKQTANFSTNTSQL